jgi:hypothetical protein
VIYQIIVLHYISAYSLETTSIKYATDLQHGKVFHNKSAGQTDSALFNNPQFASVPMWIKQIACSARRRCAPQRDR